MQLELSRDSWHFRYAEWLRQFFGLGFRIRGDNMFEYAAKIILMTLMFPLLLAVRETVSNAIDFTELVIFAFVFFVTLASWGFLIAALFVFNPWITVGIIALIVTACIMNEIKITFT